jgi:putative FmdB family regulatory protein
MPTYGYRCGSCGHEFEILQKITADALATCPKCGGKLSKMVYPAGVIFTGSGYYTTDYKGKSSEGTSGNGVAGSKDKGSEGKTAGESKSDSKSESKSDSKSESKSDTKPESKSDSKTEKAS